MIRQPTWSQSQLATLKHMYESGVPLHAIAAELNRSVGAIRGRAQIQCYRRPKRSGLREVLAHKTQAFTLGLAIDKIPAVPTVLKIASLLAMHHVVARQNLDPLCGVGPSARNNALAALKSAGLILCDEYYSPAEVILTRRAFVDRSIPGFLDLDAVRDNRLPTEDELRESLDGWVSDVCRDPLAREPYRDFILRQFLDATSGDITVADFYSIFVEVNNEENIMHV